MPKWIDKNDSMLRVFSFGLILWTGVASTLWCSYAKSDDTLIEPINAKPTTPRAQKGKLFPYTNQRATIEKIDGEDIEGLTFEQRDLKVEERPQGNYVSLEGKYENKAENGEKWTLLVRSKPVAMDRGRFKIIVPIFERQTFLQFRVVGPTGEVKKLVIGITLPEVVEPVRPGNWNFTLSLGYTRSNYSQTYYNPISMSGLTVKGSARYHVKPSRWDIGTTIYYTALPLSHSWQKTKTGSTPAANVPSSLEIRFLGVNVRVGYQLPNIAQPWTVVLMGGFYYTTMMVNATMPASTIDRTPGYRDQMGPQIFPYIRRALGSDQALGFYFKYSPITDGVGSVSLSNREMASGLSYVRSIFNKKQAIFAVDYSKLDFAKPGGAISLQTLSGSIGYGF